jgi:hypothetical protein
MRDLVRHLPAGCRPGDGFSRGLNGILTFSISIRSFGGRPFFFEPNQQGLQLSEAERFLQKGVCLVFYDIAHGDCIGPMPRNSNNGGVGK